jgi:hypothetical protein
MSEEELEDAPPTSEARFRESATSDIKEFVIFICMLFIVILVLYILRIKGVIPDYDETG